MWYGSRATDKYSGTSYEHRREWVEDKVLWLSSVFAMGICAYVLMCLWGNEQSCAFGAVCG
jgi:hypothetical protein